MHGLRPKKRHIRKSRTRLIPASGRSPAHGRRRGKSQWAGRSLGDAFSENRDYQVRRAAQAHFYAACAKTQRAMVALVEPSRAATAVHASTENAVRAGIFAGEMTRCEAGGRCRADGRDFSALDDCNRLPGFMIEQGHEALDHWPACRRIILVQADDFGAIHFRLGGGPRHQAEAATFVEQRHEKSRWHANVAGTRRLHSRRHQVDAFMHGQQLTDFGGVDHFQHQHVSPRPIDMAVNRASRCVMIGVARPLQAY